MIAALAGGDAAGLIEAREGVVALEPEAGVMDETFDDGMNARGLPGPTPRGRP